MIAGTPLRRCLLAAGDYCWTARFVLHSSHPHVQLLFQFNVETAGVDLAGSGSVLRAIRLSSPAPKAACAVGRECGSTAPLAAQPEAKASAAAPAAPETTEEAADRELLSSDPDRYYMRCALRNWRFRISELSTLPTVAQPLAFSILLMPSLQPYIHPACYRICTDTFAGRRCGWRGGASGTHTPTPPLAP